MENSLFSIRRFKLLLNRQYLENKPSLRMELLSLVAVLAGVIVLFALGKNISNDKLSGLYLVGLFLIGMLIADRSLFQSKDKLRGMFMMLSPNSRLEKVVGAIFLSSFLFPLAYTAIFYIVNLLFYFILSLTGFIKVELLVFNLNDLISTLKMLWLFQSIYILGSVWFRRMSLIKTTTAIVGFLLALTAVTGVLMFYLMSDLSASNELFDTNINVNFVSSDAFGGEILSKLTWLIAPYFWIISYFRLSEKQL